MNRRWLTTTGQESLFLYGIDNLFKTKSLIPICYLAWRKWKIMYLNLDQANLFSTDRMFASPNLSRGPRVKEFILNQRSQWLCCLADAKLFDKFQMLSIQIFWLIVMIHHFCFLDCWSNNVDISISHHHEWAFVKLQQSSEVSCHECIILIVDWLSSHI